MPKNKVSDLVTDQEMAFGRLVLSGKMTDQEAAEAVGLNPSTAAYTKSKPRVRAYMLEHRALMQQQIVEQETESLRRFTLGREQVLRRLWELASIGPEITRGSLTGQVKAMSMIVAIEGLIPDRRAGSAAMKPAPPPTQPQIYPDAWRREQQVETAGPQPNPAPDNEENQQDDGLGIPGAEPAPGSMADAPPHPDEPIYATETQRPPHAAFAPDTRVPFSIKKNRFARRR